MKRKYIWIIGLIVLGTALVLFSMAVPRIYYYKSEVKIAPVKFELIDLPEKGDLYLSNLACTVYETAEGPLPFDIEVDVTNTGELVENVGLSFCEVVDNESVEIHRITVARVYPGTFRTTTRPYKRYWMDRSQSNISIRVVVDPEDIIYESNEDNNAITRFFDENSYAIESYDIWLDSISHIWDMARGDGSIIPYSVTTTVRNDGTVTLGGGYDVVLYIKEEGASEDSWEKIDMVFTPRLEPGEAADIRFESENILNSFVERLQAGQKRFRIKIAADSEDKLPEKNERNNIRTPRNTIEL